MSDNLPSVTVVIAARPDQTDIKAVNAARRLDYPADRLDIIVARGKQPSVQRNAALKAARGDWIYFLDDDSVPEAGNLRRAAAYVSNPGVKMAGGPNLCPAEAPMLEKVFAAVLGSWLAFGPSRARYVPVGRMRETGEKELILCNLMAHRAAMLELGGFNEALYPNEENALMDELRKRGGKLIYDPQMIVYRRPRRTVGAFGRMLMTYGRGRAEQFRVNPTFGSVLNFIPPLFVVYLVAFYALTFIQNFHPASRGLFILRILFALPAALYLLAGAVQMFASMPAHGILRSVLAFPLLVASPVVYGMGFWRGLFTRLKPAGQRPDVAVSLETVAR